MRALMTAISIRGLNKTYNNGFKALDDISLEVQAGEIFALLGPNGAGKTTLISAVCGVIEATDGNIEIFGHDNVKDYHAARSLIGLVPQELTVNAFETVLDTVNFSRGLFGKPPNPTYIKEILKKLSLSDKMDSQIRMLSGGMKRRVMIAKALSHEPDILFLDEPTAGVDVQLRKSMWEQISALREIGVTIILTTHYIEEAEEIADIIGVINKGKMIITEEKTTLMQKLGKKELIINLHTPLEVMPQYLLGFNICLAEEGKKLILSYDPTKEDNSTANLLDCLQAHAIRYRDFDTRQSSLEEIFIQLVDRS